MFVFSRMKRETGFEAEDPFKPRYVLSYRSCNCCKRNPSKLKTLVLLLHPPYRSCGVHEIVQLDFGGGWLPLPFSISIIKEWKMSPTDCEGDTKRERGQRYRKSFLANRMGQTPTSFCFADVSRKMAFHLSANRFPSSDETARSCRHNTDRAYDYSYLIKHCYRTLRNQWAVHLFTPLLLHSPGVDLFYCRPKQRER